MIIHIIFPYSLFVNEKKKIERGGEIKFISINKITNSCFDRLILASS